MLLVNNYAYFTKSSKTTVWIIITLKIIQIYKIPVKNTPLAVDSLTLKLFITRGAFQSLFRIALNPKKECA